MFTLINKQSFTKQSASVIYIIPGKELRGALPISEEEMAYVVGRIQADEQMSFVFNRLSHQVFLEFFEPKSNPNHALEQLRIMADRLTQAIQEFKSPEVFVVAPELSTQQVLAFAEGMALSNYSFTAYKTDKSKNIRYLEVIQLDHAAVSDDEIEKLNIVLEATLTARSLVNMPVNYLNAEALAHEIKQMAEDVGIKAEILNKNKIEALKMGGLLAVNQGSIDPPTFTIFEYKPDDAINTQPVIFVGKGVVYDTGGLNLKPGDFMNTMKCDMSGAAAVSAAVFAIAKAQLPLHVIALAPATDNRPGENAFASGDVITMFDGQTVEIENTDAEGRMILADALAYAKKYDPMLVIDMATLTGAAARAIGNLGLVGMSSKADEFMSQLKACGEKTSERVVEFPFWDEYAEQLKSDIADMVHLGGVEGGAITAGKFLEKFTNYPYIHLDIAGPAFTTKKLNYRGTGGTGVGVRLLFEFAQVLARK
jgi:leucyl aminopeptidase